MSEPTTRIYIVHDDHAVRLIRAVNQSAAIKHACKPFTAAVATQQQLVDLVVKGVKVEEPVNGASD